MREVGTTAISPRLARAMTAGFVAMIAAVPAIQHVSELSRNPGAMPQCYEIFGSIGRACVDACYGEKDLIKNIFSANAQLTRKLRNYETVLDDDSQVNKFLRPVAQLLLFEAGAGNRQVFIGRDGWLFFKPDVDYVTGRGFLEPPIHPAAGKMPEPRQADPVRAIVDFRDQLASRDISLIVMPTPNKAMIQPDRLAKTLAAGECLQNPSHNEFLRRLRQAGVRVFDPSPVIRECSTAFLMDDSHWTPEAVRATANTLSNLITAEKILPATRPAGLAAENTELVGRGDLLRMLCLPDWFQLPIVDDIGSRKKVVVCDSWQALWQPDENADILLLGDSFSNIYSVPEMGWGRGGGLAELLSLAMQRPVDAIRINDNGAWATRQAFADKLAAGRDRLAVKKLIIWQFAVRELAIGDWRMIDLADAKNPTPPADTFYVPTKGTEDTVIATIAEIGSLPDPKTTRYAHDIGWIRIMDINGIKHRQAIVLMWSMYNRKMTIMAHLKVGQIVTLKLRPWDDLHKKYQWADNTLDLPAKFKSAGLCCSGLETEPNK